MNILLKVWTNDEKYCTEENIRRFWRRADCLPAPMQVSLNASTDISLHNISNYRLPNEEVDALCQSMLKLRASVEKLGAVPPATIIRTYCPRLIYNRWWLIG